MQQLSAVHVITHAPINSYSGEAGLCDCVQVHGQVYYLDADNFQDKELLSKLTPKDPSQRSNT